MSNYEWDHNCAVVDRLFYWEYFIRGTTFVATVMTCKDLWFIRRNWYADRAIKRIPIVYFINPVLGFVVRNKFRYWLVLNMASY